MDWHIASSIARTKNLFQRDLGTSVVELVYGISLLRSKYCMSTAFFSSEEMLSDPQIFVEDFRVIVQRLWPRPTFHHIRSKLFFHKDLYNCSHIFFKIEGNSPLDQLYTGSDVKY